MSNDQPNSSDSLTLSAALRIHAACSDFEQQLKAGRQPSIELFLIEAPELERSTLLRELIKLDLEYRRLAGPAPTRQDYRLRFPDHIVSIEEAFDQVDRLLDDKQKIRNCIGASTIPISQVEHDSGEESRVAAETPPEPPMPERLGRYKVIRKLGGGTFGIVYLAHDEFADGLVAIKVPSPTLLATSRSREEFLRELRAVRQLRHQGIVVVHDFGEEPDGRCYIVYEYIDGMTLAERINNKNISFSEAASIVAQVADALQHAHSNDLFHRDVKPGNIVLDKVGQPRLIDFGLAVREQELADEKDRLAGTYPYMSPEQVRRHWIDGRSDTFSLGVIFYELLCGRRPFNGATRDELFDQIKHREVRPPRQLDDAIPPEFERICLKALCKDVNGRYTTAKDMADDLRRVIEALGTANRAPNPPQDLAEIERRMASADAEELVPMLQMLQRLGDPSAIPIIFRCLAHPVQPVRDQARKTMHSFGWDRVSRAAQESAQSGATADISALLDGLAAFEAHPQIVGLLDHLALLLTGDLRNRAILLLERKRLGLGLNAVAELFRNIQSPYRINKVLGQGLLTATYLAHVDGADLQVAVRVLRPEFIGQPAVRAQFLDVGKRSLRLVHENLVLTREARAFPECSIYFTVRDYVPGPTLQQILDGGKRFGPNQIVQLLRQLLHALDAVHRQGMCHGGVKPSNIFLRDGDRVVLGDPALLVHGVGIALDRLSYDYRYAAPETFSCGGTMSVQADLYALGCVAYELACGQPPFVSDNYLELAGLHVHQTVGAPSQNGSRIGPIGDAVLLRLLARSVADRYGRAEQVLHELDRVEMALKGPVGPELKYSAPLLRDASIARYQGEQSILQFDESAELSPGAIQAPLEGAVDVGVTWTDEVKWGGCNPLIALEPGGKIGNYEIIRHLARGGFGAVYMVRDTRLDRIAAMKVLPLAKDQSDPQARFRNEARAVARLRHPNIVQIYDVGEHEQFMYLILEYVEGRSLTEKLRESGAQQPRLAVETLITLARAIQHAHEHGILHRDLKPSNILLTADGQPKIGDFGLAKMVEDDVTQTRDGTIIGTPAYMSPEQAAGKQHQIGPAADIYGLGAIFYELLTGQRLFTSHNVMELLSQLATTPASRPSALNPAVDRSLDAICLRCLEKDPKQRYQSAAELCDDLERWLRCGIRERKISSRWWWLFDRVFSRRGN